MIEDINCSECDKLLDKDNFFALRNKITDHKTGEERILCLDCYLAWERVEKARLAKEYDEWQRQNEKLRQQVHECEHCGVKLDLPGYVVTLSEDGRRVVWCFTCMSGTTDRIRAGLIGGGRPRPGYEKGQPPGILEVR
jgi:hypothetical protein